MGARFSSPIQTCPEAHPAYYTMSTGSLQGVKRPGRDADHLPPSSAEVMKDYSYTSTPPLGTCGLLQGQTLPYITLQYWINFMQHPTLSDK